ncbi:hypothetical protein [Pseudofrankia sp. BMG5.37]|uniref:hypothetical protein n=1 Tax=Pseudofrankia sp. BMG5.37 TaxID=3050035 RepID=UPI002893EB5A|nr:hypothetical protein [Pseudofrankia sp. BMG5.37]MDT3442075.1 hypothetical protein [Pseudofrankia sp. BMG5.37]
MSARQVRRFQLERDVDVSGVSGTGAVAFGAQAPDGTCVLWWASGLESTTIYPNMETLLAIHGHGGMTRAIYIDPEIWDGATGSNGDGGGGEASHRLDALSTNGDHPNGSQPGGHPNGSHGQVAGGEAPEAEDADEAAADPDEEPVRSTTRATARGAPRAAAHQPAVRSVSHVLRPPTRSP